MLMLILARSLLSLMIFIAWQNHFWGRQPRRHSNNSCLNLVLDFQTVDSWTRFMHICIQSSKDRTWTWDPLIIIWKWSTFFVSIAAAVGGSNHLIWSTFYCCTSTLLMWVCFWWLSDKFRNDAIFAVDYPPISTRGNILSSMIPSAILT